MMPSFIGLPLKKCIEFCEKNNIKYIIEYNSLTTNCDENELQDFVVNVVQLYNNYFKIIAILC